MGAESTGRDGSDAHASDARLAGALSTPRQEDRVAVERERSLLLAAITGLRDAADAAMQRAEAAEEMALQSAEAVKVAQAAEAAALQRAKAAEAAEDSCISSLRRALKERLRDAVVSEVQAAVRSAAEEATAELRAAAEEIRRLRADACARSNDAVALDSSTRTMRDAAESAAAGTGDEQWACPESCASGRTSGHASAPESGDSSPAQHDAGGPEAFGARPALLSTQTTAALGAASSKLCGRSPKGSLQGAVLCRARCEGEAEPLRVRDVVSKLERQREKSSVRVSRTRSAAAARSAHLEVQRQCPEFWGVAVIPGLGLVNTSAAAPGPATPSGPPPPRAPGVLGWGTPTASMSPAVHTPAPATTPAEETAAAGAAAARCMGRPVRAGEWEANVAAPAVMATRPMPARPTSLCLSVDLNG